MIVQVVMSREKEASVDALKKDLEKKGWEVLGFPTIEYIRIVPKQA